MNEKRPPDIDFTSELLFFDGEQDNGSRRVRIWCNRASYEIHCAPPYQNSETIISLSFATTLHKAVMHYPPQIRKAILEHINAYHAAERLTS